MNPVAILMLILFGIGVGLSFAAILLDPSFKMSDFSTENDPHES